MISIIIPTKNEAKNIEELILRIKKTLKKDFEIIVADSNSQDETCMIAKKTAKKAKINLKTFNTGSLDLSNSAVYGFKKASGDYLALIDGDLQHPPELLSKMFKVIKKEDADIVIGSRFVKGSKTKFGLHRQIIARLFRFLITLFIPKIKVKDPATGFFMFKKEIIKNINLRPSGFRTLLEILVKAKYKKVIEIPFIFQDRKKGKSKLNIKKALIDFSYLVRTWKQQREHIRFIKFCIIGLTGVIINEGLLWGLTEFAKLFYLVSSIIAIEVSIISNFFLNDIWTFRKQRHGNIFKRLIRFNLARILTVIINFAILWVLTSTSLKVNYLISNLIGIIIATLTAYFLSTSWVWKEK